MPLRELAFVYIGQLQVTARMHYPVVCSQSQDPNASQWTPVRLDYDHVLGTIQIKAPHTERTNSEPAYDEAFGLVEQRVATAIGPFLAEDVIRLEAEMWQGPSDVNSLFCPYILSIDLFLFSSLLLFLSDYSFMPPKPISPL